MTRRFSFLNKVWNTSLAILQLVRAWNVVLIMSAVYLGAFLAAGSSLDVTDGYLILCALATGLVAASAYAMNDLLDIESDRQNHVERPLVTGLISTKTGLWLSRLPLVGNLSIAFVVALSIPFGAVLFGESGFVLFSVVPFLLFSFGGLYLLMMSVTNLFLVLPMSMSKTDGKEASVTSSTLKWAMMCGMVALALSESIPLSHTP